MSAPTVSSSQPPVPRIGVSACLLGRNVRYDGGHRGEQFFSERLSRFVEWIPVCPEVEMGLGTPRPRIDLHRTPEAELRMIQSGTDITGRMQDYARSRLAEPDLNAPLSGYLFKARSPSCGIGSVRVLHEDGSESADAFGLFARAFRERYPAVPVFDETMLADRYALEAAVCAFFTMHRWHGHRAGGSIRAFHRAHRVLLTARDAAGVLELDDLAEAADESMGALEAGAGATSESLIARRAPVDSVNVTDESVRRYEMKMAEMLRRVPTRENHARALEALADEIESELPAGGRERREAQAVVRHLVSLYPTGADLEQTLARIEELLAIQLSQYANAYLRPHPTALSLYQGL